MKKTHFPLYDIRFRKINQTRNQPQCRSGGSISQQIQLNVPLKLTKLEINDFLKKVYTERHLGFFNLNHIRTLIQKKDRKLFSRNLYLKKNYKKAIITTRLNPKK